MVRMVNRPRASQRIQLREISVTDAATDGDRKIEIDPKELKLVLIAALTRSGMSPNSAAIFSNVMTQAEIDGSRSHDVQRFSSLLDPNGDTVGPSCRRLPLQEAAGACAGVLPCSQTILPFIMTRSMPAAGADRSP
jgi:hypothetical protein